MEQQDLETLLQLVHLKDQMVVKVQETEDMLVVEAVVVLLVQEQQDLHLPQDLVEMECLQELIQALV